MSIVYWYHRSPIPHSLIYSIADVSRCEPEHCNLSVLLSGHNGTVSVKCKRHRPRSRNLWTRAYHHNSVNKILFYPSHTEALHAVYSKAAGYVSGEDILYFAFINLFLGCFADINWSGKLWSTLIEKKTICRSLLDKTL